MVKSTSIFVTQKGFCIVLTIAVGIAALALSGGSIAFGIIFKPLWCAQGVDCCYSDNQCMQNLGYSCINSICECDYGNISSKFTYFCGGYDWTCSNDTNCRDNLGLRCKPTDTLSTCRCDENNEYFDFDLRRCVPLKSYVEPCSSTVLCDHKQGLSCSSNECKCPPGQYFHLDRLHCVDLESFYGSCRANSDCDSSLGLVCYQGSYCNCTDTTYWNDAACETKRDYGRSCRGSPQYECNNLASLRCRWTLSINFPYNSEDDCANNDCPPWRQICSCSDTHYYDYFTNTCVLKKLYGSSCKSSRECDVSRSLTCGTSATSCNCPTKFYARACDCPANTYYDSYSQYCRRTKSFESSCTQDFECDSRLGLMCNTTMCACDQNNWWNSRICIPKKTFNLTCVLAPIRPVNVTNSTMNYTMNYTTTTERPTTTQNFTTLFFNLTIEYNNTNYTTNATTTTTTTTTTTMTTTTTTTPAPRYGPIDCDDNHGLVCTYDARCECLSDYYWDGVYCERKKEHNDYCYTDYECNSNLGFECQTMVTNLTYASTDEYQEESRPDVKICLCRKDLYYNFTSKNCTAKKTYGYNCTSTRECNDLKGLFCSSNETNCSCNGRLPRKTCDCAEGYYFDIYEDRCRLPKLFNERCNSTYYCDTTRNLTCDYNCTCNEYNWWNGTECIPKKEYNMSCTYYYNVTNYNVTSNDTANATTEYTTAAYTIAAYTTAAYNTTEPLLVYGVYECDNNIGLVCSEFSLCDCSPGYWYSTNHTLCVSKYMFNETCFDSIQCLSGNCTTGYCY